MSFPPQIVKTSGLPLSCFVCVRYSLPVPFARHGQGQLDEAYDECSRGPYVIHPELKTAYYALESIAFTEPLNYGLYQTLIVLTFKNDQTNFPTSNFVGSSFQRIIVRRRG
jgi:hypothetical protein